MKQESFKVSIGKFMIKYILVFIVSYLVSVLIDLLVYDSTISVIILPILIIFNIIFFSISSDRKNDVLIIDEEKILIMQTDCVRNTSAGTGFYDGGSASYQKKVVYKPYSVEETLFNFIITGNVETIYCQNFLLDNQEHGIPDGNKLKIKKYFKNIDKIRELLNK